MGKNQTMSEKMTRIYSIDILKLIGAFLVLMIHARPFYDLSEEAGILLTDILTRTAVPFFFAVSGYFLLRDGEEGKRSGKRRILGLIKYYVIFSLIYLIWEMLGGSYAGLEPGAWAVLMVKRFCFYGIYYHLWYFPCAIAAMALSAISIRAGAVKHLAFFSVFFYLAGVFTYTWYEPASAAVPLLERLMESFDFDYLRRFLCDALPFTMLGYFVLRTERFWLRRKKELTICLILAIIINAAEVETAVHLGMAEGTTLSFGLLPAVYFLLVWALMTPMEQAKRAGRFSRAGSLLVFGLHPVVLEMVQRILPENFPWALTVSFAAAAAILLAITILYTLTVQKGREIACQKKKN